MPTRNPTPEQRAKWNRTYYERGGKAKVDAKRAEYRARNIAFLNALKNKPCADCNQAYPVVCMDFDHINEDKDRALSILAFGCASLDRLAHEVAKCEVVCSNCHRIRTARRREGKRPPYTIDD